MHHITILKAPIRIPNGLWDKSLPEKIKPEAKLSMKDDYAFDFLELADEHTEHELERAILSRVEDFLREMGHVFSLWDRNIVLK